MNPRTVPKHNMWVVLILADNGSHWMIDYGSIAGTRLRAIDRWLWSTLCGPMDKRRASWRSYRKRGDVCCRQITITMKQEVPL